MTAALAHTSWCVKQHEKGPCSDKRGHWDRTSITWVSQLTDDDRRMI